MKTVVQRVERARVLVGGETVGEIGRGALLLVCVETADTEVDAAVTARKIAALRFFPGRTPMDRTLADIGGACLVVSQFTLAGDVARGNRPSFTRAAAPEHAEFLYELVTQQLRDLGLEVATGRFAASMQVELVNDGPVTLIVTTSAGRVV
jgi:D-tyrosyl-tRNA(Tyr) deacylase